MTPSALAATNVACNIYMTLGARSSHRKLLQHLLTETQTHCRQLQQVILVHAYTDKVYNRSSFHLAGTPSQIVSVASQLVSMVLRKVPQQEPDHHHAGPEESLPTAHPTVGLVDHVSVMPLTYDPDSKRNEGTEALPDSGLTAKNIGAILQKRHPEQRILYYGDAHDQKRSLAATRRECTDFFQPPSASRPDGTHRHTSPTMTIGAPSHGFVENYNLRLRSNCSRRVAITLTRRLREASWGTVEALTLAYSQGRQEVACNLLQPAFFSAQQILKVAEEWEAQTGGDQLIDCGYRVGTTVNQCLVATSVMHSDTQRQAYDDKVRRQLDDYLNL